MTNANIDRSEWDAYDDFTGVEPAHRWRDLALPVTLDDALVPLDQAEQYVPNHLDADGTLHFFAAVAHEPDGSDRAHELRYFRVAQTDDGRLIHDAHPVMTLPNWDADPFPRQTLDTMLMDGDLDNAQELAYQTAQAHGLAFPEPEALPALNTGVDYRFDIGIEDDGSPTLEAVKSWRDGALDQEERLTIASYGMATGLEVDLRELNDLRARDGLEAALNLAESMAVASGYLHDGRADPRLFTEGPPDPFMTLAEHDRAVEAGVVFTFDDEDTQPLPTVEPATSDVYTQWMEAAHHQREAHAHLAGAAWFTATFADDAERVPLQPLDDTVNYALVVQDTDPWTTELAVEKVWRTEHDEPGFASLTLAAYDLEVDPQREQAEAARATLLGVHEEHGLATMMQHAEATAVANGELNAERADGRLFTDGPLDRFTTTRELEQEAADLPAVSLPEPGSWEELLEQERQRVETEPEPHYWQMHHRPVETPEGDPLGTALFVTEYPQFPPDLEAYFDETGVSTFYPTRARALELAHFSHEDDARKFETEFRSYLVPGLLDGPELAPEVAKLEGLSGAWVELDDRGIVDIMSGDRPIVRGADDWHRHDPHAEREGRAQAKLTQSDMEL